MLQKENHDRQVTRQGGNHGQTSFARKLHPDCIWSCSILLQSAAMAEIRLSIRDNADPEATFLGTASSAPFIPGKEWRFVAPDSSMYHHDLINPVPSAVTWSFDERTRGMTGVAGTDATPGSADSGSSCQTGCPGLAENNSLFGGDLGMVAPYRGSVAGSDYGAGVVTIISSGLSELMTVEFPDLEMQWRGNSIFMGRSTRWSNVLLYADNPAG